MSSMSALAPSMRMRLFAARALWMNVGPSTTKGFKRAASSLYRLISPSVSYLRETSRVRQSFLRLVRYSVSNALKVTVTLETTLDERAELGRERLLVEEVVNTETRAGRLRRVSWSDPALGGTDRRAAELDLLKAIDDLVEVENEVGAVGNEETAVAVQACGVVGWVSLGFLGAAKKTLERKVDAPFLTRLSSSSKKAGTWTTTPLPMKAVHSGLTRPGRDGQGRGKHACRGKKETAGGKRKTPPVSHPARAGKEKRTGREKVEVELGLDALDGRDDGVAGVVSSSAAGADIGFSGEDVDKLALACGCLTQTGDGVVWSARVSRGETGERNVGSRFEMRWKRLAIGNYASRAAEREPRW